MQAIGWRAPNRLELGWGLLAAACVATMVAWPSWETIPFHVIWITLTLLYGFRVWSVGTTSLVLGAVIVGTWISHGLGSLSDERLAIVAASLLIVGIQIFFSSFLLSILGLRRSSSP